ncbi:MAG: hypothetical protein A3H57_04890 [Candidatus Taylorbacteria bacterium RIFCSPLOWO2_02_FULL_43_11]|uniref:Uncharacterized protein n=1 Tax=Candidatus Taylorbacteria bacterium RIFCSPHIGHO2_02_FULL_43_32b TaxID=1802306 RepID=A0A1G2ME81_9BACT|nr:MAG: hypothetical protein A3C72_01510 [Candidatus Taylorbacteria bacterium RIFCSPHIGHO2_02_FULL_43_32b]OHA37783.1 MAG: hypothetical protein A3H57_04890 [Candidatus Taylorbacteria bacterium RIFCSPLOWO2_02_FULL_43_11]
MKYLKSKQEYIDRYDRATVKDCRWRENFHKNYKPSEELATKAPPNFHKAVSEMTLHYDLLFATIDWWEKKNTTIQGWMEKDQHRDDMLDSARPPANIRCLKCYSFVTPNQGTIYDLDEKVRVLFFYECAQGCVPLRAFFNDGEEYKSKPDLCPKCQTQLNKKRERIEGEKIITTSMCPSCDYTNTDEMDLHIKPEEPDPDFEKDRARFCLTEETSKKPLEEKWQMEGMAKMVDDWKEKEKHKEDYEAVKKIQKLTVIDLEKVFTPIIETAGYVKLQFGTPDMGKDLFLPFSLHDAKTGRSDYDSSHTLQKLIKEAMVGTNWRLMTDGISYRLGILTGRLRAYEREEDLLELVRSKKKNEKETVE